MKNWQAFIDGLHQYLRDALSPLHTRLKGVEARVAALESEAQQREYKGVYEDGQTYLRHNSVTYDGSLWIVTAEKAAARPPGNGWRLAVRAGRDAR